MIVRIDRLPRLLKARRQNRVVLCHGCFDLLHIGHIRHLKEAARMGGTLVVTVTPDVYVRKGPGRPVFPQDMRAEAVAALACVDFVAVNSWTSAVETIYVLRPDVYVKGYDYQDNLTPALLREKDAVEDIGGVMAFTGGDSYVTNSTKIFQKVMSVS